MASCDDQCQTGSANCKTTKLHYKPTHCGVKVNIIPKISDQASRISKLFVPPVYAELTELEMPFLS